jgi:hypothetical protein
VLIGGAVVFLLAAFAPASFVFGMDDPDEQRRFLAKHERSWRWGQVPFAAGAVTSGVGLVVLGVEVGESAGTAITAAGVVATAVALPWAEHCRQRALRVEAFLEGRLPAWPFVVYVWGTLAALATTGLASLSSDVPEWAAAMLMGWSGLLAVAMLRFGDVPPFVFYLATVALGIAVL